MLRSACLKRYLAFVLRIGHRHRRGQETDLKGRAGDKASERSPETRELRRREMKPEGSGAGKREVKENGG